MPPRFQRPRAPEKGYSAERQLQSGGDDGVNFMQASLGVDDGPRTENHGNQDGHTAEQGAPAVSKSRVEENQQSAKSNQHGEDCLARNF